VITYDRGNNEPPEVIDDNSSSSEFVFKGELTAKEGYQSLRAEIPEQYYSTSVDILVKKPILEKVKDTWKETGLEDSSNDKTTVLFLYVFIVLSRVKISKANFPGGL